MPDQSSLTPSVMDAIGSVFHRYDPPLWLVTSRAGERRGGLIATSAMRASILPEMPRMLIAIAKQHHTWELIEASCRFTLHLLRADDLDAVWRFGLSSGHAADKLSGLEVQEAPGGSLLYAQAAAWLDCRVETSMDIGDRTAYLAEVLGGCSLWEGPVLTVAGLMRQAPEGRRAELEQLYASDQEIDAAAIGAWRRERRRP